MRFVTAQRPRQLSRESRRGLFISELLITELSYERIPCRDAEGAQDKADQTIGREHNEHAEESVEDLPLTLFPLTIGRLRTDELKDTKEEEQKRYRESKRDDRVEYELIDLT